MSTKHLLTFQKSWPPYNSGETAGFAIKTAARLLAAGIAVPADRAMREQAMTRQLEGASRTSEIAKDDVRDAARERATRAIKANFATVAEARTTEAIAAKVARPDIMAELAEAAATLVEAPAESKGKGKLYK